jgi:saccharopine dehydrogenase (NADP+, L-glutamate forming)
MKAHNLSHSAKDAGITVMNEIGLDPGIDHLYAVKTIEEVHNEGGKVMNTP